MWRWIRGEAPRRLRVRAGDLADRLLHVSTPQSWTSLAERFGMVVHARWCE
uniref:Uncharacterized protein n=1 Tax=Arundo donax TaxID=35708 RepID=A0A0A9HQA7_ARUDO